MEMIATSPDPIDRVGPTLRPEARSVMRQRWADLLFLHWEVPAEELRRQIPRPLEVDTFEGRAFIGLVPFTMTGVRPVWSPAVPWLSSFHEVNVRTYVHCEGRDPGVWFFSLDAANPIAVTLARRLWHLPYHHARMRVGRRTDVNGTMIEYESVRRADPGPASCRIRYRPIGVPAPSPLGTLEHFLAERYILYASCGDRLYSGRVHHTPYPLQPARVEELEESLIAAAGIRRPETKPLAHYASEVRTQIFPLRRVPDVRRR